MASHEHTIKIGIDVDTSALGNIETTLSKLDNTTFNINVGGNAEETINNINSQLGGLNDREIRINVGGNIESTLDSIDTSLARIERHHETEVDVGGKALCVLEDLQYLVEGLERPVEIPVHMDTSTVAAAVGTLTGAIESVGTLIMGLMAEISRQAGQTVKSIDSTLGNLARTVNSIHVDQNMGFDNIAKNIQSATGEVGTLQRELNSLSVPEIAPNVNMPSIPNTYYGGFNGMGNLSLGGIGGSSILSMFGLGAAKDVIWGNSTQAQTNAILLKKIGNGQLTQKTYEGGTTDIADAVTNTRMISMQMMIPQLYAFATATGATTEQLMAGGDEYTGHGSGVDIITAFGEHVSLMTGSDSLAETAMYDLSKGFKGATASIDQYGITLDKLAEHGFKKGDKDVEKYLKAVGEIIGAYDPNELLTDTTTGGLATARKVFSASGKKIGNLFLEPVNDLANLFNRLDSMDIDFMGLTIPKRTISQTILGVTALTSAIGPLEMTIDAVKDTFHKISGAASAASQGLTTFIDKLRNIRNMATVNDFQQLGATGMLDRSRYNKSIEALYDVSTVRGLFDYSDEEIDASDMNGGQKRRTKAEKANASKLFDLESDKTFEAHRRMRDDIMTSGMEQFEKSLEGKDLAERMTLRSQEIARREKEAAEALDAYDIGRKNQIAGMSKRQKLGMGFKNSFKPQKDAWNSAFKRSRGKYEGKGIGSWFKRNTVGNARGLVGGIKGVKGSGIGASIGNFGSVLTGLVSCINPATLAIYGLMAGITALAGIFLIAYSNSEEFRNKVATLFQQLHGLFDTIAYFIGDMLQASGLTKSGGMNGVVEMATNILNALIKIIGVVETIMEAVTGRDVKQSRNRDEHLKTFEKTLDKVKQQEAERGGIGEADDQLYQTLANSAQNVSMWDPDYFTPEKLKEYGLDPEQYNKSVWGRNLIQAFQNPDAWNYVRDEKLPKFNEAHGTNLTYEEYMSYGEEGLNKAGAEDTLYKNTWGILGKPMDQALAEQKYDKEHGTGELRDSGHFWSSVLGGIGGSLGGAVLGAIGSAIISAILSAIGGWIAGALAGALTGVLGGLLSGALGSLGGMIAGAAIGSSLPVIGTIIGAIIGIIFGPKIFDAIMPYLQGLGEALWGFGSWVMGGLKMIWDALSGVDWGGIFEAIVPYLFPALTALKTIGEHLIGFFQWLGEAFSGLGEWLGQFTSTDAEGRTHFDLGAMLSDIGGKIWQYICDWINSIDWQGMMTGALDGITGFGTQLWNDLTSGIVDGITGFQLIAPDANGNGGYNVGNLITDITNGLETVGKFFAQISGFLTDPIGTLMSALGASQGMGNGSGGMSWISDIVNNLMILLDVIGKISTGDFSGIFDSLSNLKLLPFGDLTLGDVFSGVQGVIGDVINNFTILRDVIMDILSGDFSGIFDSLANLKIPFLDMSLGDVFAGVQEFLNGIMQNPIFLALFGGEEGGGGTGIAGGLVTMLTNANMLISTFIMNLQTVWMVLQSLLMFDFATAWESLRNFNIPFFGTLGSIIDMAKMKLHEAIDWIVGNNFFQAAIGGVRTLIGLIGHACLLAAQLAATLGGLGGDFLTGGAFSNASATLTNVGNGAIAYSQGGGSGTSAKTGAAGGETPQATTGAMGGEIFNSNYSSGSGYGSPSSSESFTQGVDSSLRNSTVNNNTQNKGSTVINNNLSVKGTGDDEALAKKVVNVINNRFLWDAQKAGRTVDG